MYNSRLILSESIAIDTRSDGTYNGASASAGSVVIHYGGIAYSNGYDADASVIVKVQDSTNNSSWSDYYTITTLDIDSSADSIEYDYDGSKSYIRVVVVIDGLELNIGADIYSIPDILTDVKEALRITASAYDSEIEDLILACKSDLGISGVLDDSIINTDALIKRAIITYCKAYFGYDNPDCDKLIKSYELIRNQLTLSTDYAYYSILVTVVNSNTTPIREAKVIFDGETKYTDSNGEVTFYRRKGSNYYYSISADDYSTDDDDDNLQDVNSNTTINITLSGV